MRNKSETLKLRQVHNLTSTCMSIKRKEFVKTSVHLTETVQFVTTTQFNQNAPDIGKVQPEVPIISVV